VSGPWDDYKPAAKADSGPWADYAPSPRPVTAPMVQPSPSIGPGPRTSAMPDQPMTLRPWGDVALDFVGNLPKSLWNDVAVPTYQAFRDRPLETLENIPRSMVGVLDNIPGPERSLSPQRRAEREADYNRRVSPETRDYRAGSKAIGKAIIDDFAGYTDLPTLQDRLANHPGRVVMDASTVLPVLGAPGRAATGVIDPLTAAGNVAKYTAKGAELGVSPALGGTTGAGAASVRAAGRAGLEGGDVATTFRANMRGDVPVTDIVGQAKSALDAVRTERNAAYRSGMKNVEAVDRPLPFKPIDDALAGSQEIANFKGVELNPSAASTKSQIQSIVDDWRTLNPDSPIFKDVPRGDLTPEQFHTPIGLDALKRLVGDIRDSSDFGSPARAAAERVYNAIGSEIRKGAPEYAKVMADYQSASNKLGEATRTFSLGEKATGDTAARKLLSATRHNVQTNFGERARLLDVLADKDPTLPYAIAGQTLNSIAPQGLVARGGLMGGALSVLSNPYLLAAAPSFMPRVVGEAAHAGGRAIRNVDNGLAAARINPSTIRAAERGSYQAGRNDEIAQRALELYRLRQAAQGNPYLQGAF
jgi:hypothetical protein